MLDLVLAAAPPEHAWRLNSIYFRVMVEHETGNAAEGDAWLERLLAFLPDPPGALRPSRNCIWGMLAAAVWPLLTVVHDSMMIILCPLGAICASAAVAIARGAELHGSEQPSLLGSIGRLLRNPLRAACASGD